MNVVYRVVGTSKQAFHQKLNRQLHLNEQQAQLEVIVLKIRKDHPRMSSRQIYRLVKPDCMGRDRFEKWCHQLGLKVKTKRSYQRTTNSFGVTRFNNLIHNKELTGVNQVWVSDITYFRIQEKFYYITFIMDKYSRFIVGHSVSRNLYTENTTLAALKTAVKSRKYQINKGLIFHSDGGGQYYSHEFIKLTAAQEMKNSMGESVYDNPHAERINGTIKNDYLIPYSPSNYRQLITMTNKAVKLYNIEKPHEAIQNLSPAMYESKLLVN